MTRVDPVKGPNGGGHVGKGFLPYVCNIPNDLHRLNGSGETEKPEPA